MNLGRMVCACPCVMSRELLFFFAFVRAAYHGGGFAACKIDNGVRAQENAVLTRFNYPVEALSVIFRCFGLGFPEYASGLRKNQGWGKNWRCREFETVLIMCVSFLVTLVLLGDAEGVSPVPDATR